MYDDNNGYRNNSDNGNYSYYDSSFRTQGSSSGSSYNSGNTNGSDRNRNSKKKGGFGKTVGKAACLGLVFGLVASGTMFGFNKATGSGSSASSASSSSTAQSVNIVQTSSKSVSTTDSDDVSDIVDQVMPSIVAVNTTIEETSSDIFGRQYTQEGEGAGSGIIISSTDDYLYILTNYHVIENSKTVSVQFSDDSDADATVKGYDEDADIAVLEVKMSDLSSDTKGTIKVAVMGDSDSLKAGESAIAIGNALGYGQSVTTGVISAVSREVQLTDKTMTLIQTSAAINPGNSGGALLNGKGEVIGINTVKYSDTDVEGMGYAIPINSAIETAKGIIDGTITTKTDDNTAYLGIKGGTIDETAASNYNMPQGVYVSSVDSGSAAARAGLEAGCIITKFNGKDVKTIEELQEALESCAPGDSVTITAQFRGSDGNYTEQELTTVLGSKADASSSTSSDDSSSNAETEQYNFGGSDDDSSDYYGGFWNQSPQN